MTDLKCYIFSTANDKERKRAEGWGKVLADGTVEIFAKQEWADRFAQKVTGNLREIPLEGERP